MGFHAIWFVRNLVMIFRTGPTSLISYKIILRSLAQLAVIINKTVQQKNVLMDEIMKLLSYPLKMFQRD